MTSRLRTFDAASPLVRRVARILSLALCAPLLVSPAGCGGGDPATGGAAARRNLLVVSIDTLRRDHVGLHGASPTASPTPALDALGRSATVFDDAFTTSPVTLPAHTSLLTGLYPVAHGVRDNGATRVPAAADTLAEQLKRAGYRTHAVVAAFVLNECFGLAQGFDAYDAPTRGMKSADMHVREVRADAVVDKGLAAIDALAGGDAPFFLFLHLYDPHFPYEAPGTAPGLAQAAAYAGEVAYVDAQLARLFDGLKQRGLWDELALVVTSDHGEGLEDGDEVTHGYFVYDETMRVPLIVKHPGLAPGRVAGPVSLVDVVPTLQELLEIPLRSGAALDGTSLVAAARDGRAPERTLALETYLPLISHGWAPFQAGVNGEAKYVRGVTPELSDRAADPGEERDLAGSDPREAALAEEVARMFGDAAHRLERESVDLDSTDRATLAALGYAGSTSGLDEGDLDWSALPDTHERYPLMKRLWSVFGMLEAGQADAALAELRSLAKLDPNNPEVLTSLAKVAVTSPATPLDVVAEIEEGLQRARLARPLDAEIPWLLARCAMCRAVQARQAMQTATDDATGRAASDEWRAQTARLIGELEAVLALEPGHVKALGNLATTHFDEANAALSIQRPDLARAHLERVVARTEELLPLLGPGEEQDRARFEDLRARAAAALPKLPR